jgi:hypothetical protein
LDSDSSGQSQDGEVDSQKLAHSPPLLKSRPTLAGSLNGGSVALIDDIPPGLDASDTTWASQSIIN